MGGRSFTEEDLAVKFSGIEDPRTDRNKKYPLYEIIFLVLCGALCDADSWRGIEILGEERLDFLRRFFPFSKGIPSHQTIGRVFSLLRPKSFEAFFQIWSSEMSGSNNGKHIAIDGKTSRGSSDKSVGKQALHLLHAFAVESGITLAQLEVDAKTNEIKVVPDMIDSLDVEGAMISVDALNTQKEIAEKIIDAKADYTLALKGNHKTLNEHVGEVFDFADAVEKSSEYYVEETEKSHGRVVKRSCDIVPLEGIDLEKKADWKGLKALGRVQTSVWKNGQESFETRYYLLSYCNVQLFAKTARGHWAVEAMHWTLDVTFSEDLSQKRKDHAPRNYSLVRKFALNIIKKCKGKLTGPNAKLKALCNPQFLEKMLVESGFKLAVN